MVKQNNKLWDLNRLTFIFSHLEYFLKRLEKKELEKGLEMGEDRRISIKREKWNPKNTGSKL